MKMRRLLSWTGLALCVVYLLLTAWLVHGAQSDADPKGAYILMSLPITLKSAALDAIGAGSLLYGNPGRPRMQYWFRQHCCCCTQPAG